MNAQPDNFEKLRRLLTLKSHEQPPPGYFDRLAAQVMERLEAGEASGPVDVYERLALEAPWVLRLWQTLVARPLTLGGAAAALCAALVVGVFYVQGLEVTTGGVADGQLKLAGVPAPPSLVFNPPSEKPIFLSSTNPLPNLRSGRSLFEAITVETQPTQGFLPGSR